MNFTSFIIALIIVSMFAGSFGIFLGDLTTTYNITTNTSFVDTYNKIDMLVNKTNQINNQVQGQESQEGDTTTSLLKIGFATASIVYSAIGLVNSMINDISLTIGLPPFIVGGVLAIIIIILGLYVISVLTKSFFKL